MSKKDPKVLLIYPPNQRANLHRRLHFRGIDRERKRTPRQDHDTEECSDASKRGSSKGGWQTTHEGHLNIARKALAIFFEGQNARQLVDVRIEWHMT